MAGSYGHVVSKNGSLRKPEQALGMLNMGGALMGGLAARDVYMCIEEMYGMIHYLAHKMADEDRFDDADYEMMREYFIEEARKNYRQGLILSPTKRFKEKSRG